MRLRIGSWAGTTALALAAWALAMPAGAESAGNVDRSPATDKFRVGR